jgi:ribosome-binding protein aMBF1 (putative translation factor)
MLDTMTLKGKKYVLVPEAEYERLAGVALPPLPKADRKGRRPARQTVRATLARSIIRKRVAAGLSQKELAEQAGISPETLSRIESGKHRPQTATIDKIAQALEEVADVRAAKKVRRERGDVTVDQLKADLSL